jgi:hypothetical protein
MVDRFAIPGGKNGDPDYLSPAKIDLLRTELIS